MPSIFTDVPVDGALKRLQASYSQLFESYPLPMLVVELASLRLLAANDAAVRCYGYSMSRITEMHLPDLYFEEDQAALPAYMAVGPLERARQRNWRHQGEGGRAIDVEIDSENMQLHGLPTRMLLIQDVTQERAAQRARQEQARRLPETVQLAADGFVQLDLQARYLVVNRHAEELLQVPADYLLGKTLWETCPQASDAAYRARFEGVARDRQAISFEFLLESRQLWLEVRAFASGEGVAAYFRDVSAQHRNAERLAQEHERLQAVVNASNDAIISIDASGRVQSFNPGAERVFGNSSASMVGKSIQLLLPERFRAAHVQHKAQFAASECPPRMMGLNRVKGLRADGQEIDLEATIGQVTIGQEQVLIATLRDVTAHDRADAERQAAQAQLSHLTHRLMSQEKDLVKRVAQSLHDQLGQTTATIRILHESMGVLRRGSESREFLRLDRQLGKLIDQATRQVRMVLVDLHPPLLDENGLAAALDNELRSRALVRQSMNFELHVVSAVQDLRWPSAVEYGAFMIARKAIENALRHSKASQVTLNLGGGPGRLQLEVCDNGHGIVPRATSSPGHLGIAGMQERAQSIGGALTVSPSQPGTLIRPVWQGSE
jgi:PAS domain S-box-containing protein